jgi:hypothetical protein
MTPLTATDVLALWERAAGRSPGDRALVLAAGCAGMTPAAAAELAVGDRDRLLVAAHRRLFGRRVTGRADCPACGELLEIELDLSELGAPPAAPAGPLLVGACEVGWRLPTAGDVADAARLPLPAAARDELARRCVTGVTRGGEPVPPPDWPDGVAAAVAAAAAAADPLMDLRVELTCVRCGHGWAVGFDPSAFLWSELCALARRLLGEVHRLASAYGWREADILAMTAARRAAYLRMCGG